MTTWLYYDPSSRPEAARGFLGEEELIQPQDPKYALGSLCAYTEKSAVFHDLKSATHRILVSWWDGGQLCTGVFTPPSLCKPLEEDGSFSVGNDGTHYAWFFTEEAAKRWADSCVYDHVDPVYVEPAGTYCMNYFPQRAFYAYKDARRKAGVPVIEGTRSCGLADLAREAAPQGTGGVRSMNLQ